MALRVHVLIGGFALLLVSAVDASMRCLHLRSHEGGIMEGIKNTADELGITNTCPPPFFITSSDEFCCYGWDMKPYCCDAGSVIMNWSIIAVVFLIILMLLSTIVSCVCCLCCPCCWLHKRRQGRVFQTKHSAIVTTQNPNRPPIVYQPIAQSQTNLPPGAYPVFPPGSGTRYYTRSP